VVIASEVNLLLTVPFSGPRNDSAGFFDLIQADILVP